MWVKHTGKGCFIYIKIPITVNLEMTLSRFESVAIESAYNYDR